MLRYADLDEGRARVTFSGAPEKVTHRMGTTREGFLICREVALARTGEQSYASYEVPLEPGPSGMVTVERLDDDVFDPETIASFSGKPFTNDHPAEDVSPDNYRTHLVGVVQNPRRGTGDRSHCIVGDLIIYDKATIQQVRAGKREVSVGYDADYLRIGRGRGRQVNIRANHVSLVDYGRCGPTCAITDRKTNMSTQDKLSPGKIFLNSLRDAFKYQDDDEKLMKSLQSAAATLEEKPKDSEIEGETDNLDEEKKGVAHTVTVNIGGMEHKTSAAKDKVMTSKANTKDADPEEGAGEESSMDAPVTKAEIMELMQPVVEAIQGITKRLDSVESAMEEASDPDDTQTQDAVARAEVLFPGIKLPTFDSKPGSKANRDAVTNFKRSVLNQALGSERRVHVLPYVQGPRPSFDSMPPEALDVVFRAASQHARDAQVKSSVNLVRGSGTAAYTLDEKGQKGGFDNQAWNDANKKFWVGQVQGGSAR